MGVEGMKKCNMPVSYNLCTYWDYSDIPVVSDSNNGLSAKESN